MTDGYIAVVGPDATNLAHALRVHDQGATLEVDRSNFLLLVEHRTGFAALDDLRGGIVGTVFDRSGRHALTAISAPQTRSAVDSDAGSLVEQFWGGFVGFVIGDDGSISVVRDPSGAMPCYHMLRGKTHVFGSHVGSFFRSGFLTPAIDWRTVAQHLLWPERRSRTTGLVAIDELMPGERLMIDKDDSRRDLIWNPWRFAAPDKRIDDREQAVELVRRATQNSVAAWCRRYPRPLVSLSGGLDSSIVMACLTTQAAGAVTFLTDEALGDERRYARAVAAHFDTALSEQPLSVGNIDPRRSNAAALPRPVSRLFAQELDNIWRDAVRESDADALFHGGGGDNVYCFLESATPYLDSLLARGPGRDTYSTLLDLSHMTRVSTWRLRLAATRKLILHRGRYRWFRDPTFLTPHGVTFGKHLEDHPWFAAQPPRMLPGKRAHVASIVRVQNYLDAVEPSRAAPVVAPLVSQPVIEACLRVPTWAWCTGGINRSIAREAFAAKLPAAIVERAGKGSPDAFDAQTISDNRATIRAMLLDGLLSAQNLIDRAMVDAALTGSGPMRGTAYLRISDLVNVEAWLQSWAGSRRGGVS